MLRTRQIRRAGRMAGTPAWAWPWEWRSVNAFEFCAIRQVRARWDAVPRLVEGGAGRQRDMLTVGPPLFWAAGGARKHAECTGAMAVKRQCTGAADAAPRQRAVSTPPRAPVAGRPAAPASRRRPDPTRGRPQPDIRAARRKHKSQRHGRPHETRNWRVGGVVRGRRPATAGRRLRRLRAIHVLLTASLAGWAGAAERTRGEPFVNGIGP